MAHAIQNLKRAQDKQKQYADKRRRELELYVGDEVLLSTRNFPVKIAVGWSQKLGPLHCGPFTVLEKYIAAYKLDLPPHMKIHLVFHVSQLKLHKKLATEMRTCQKPYPIVTVMGQE